MRRLQAEYRWPSRWLAARYLIKLAVYHILTQPSIHRYPRLAYERFGRRNPLPTPTNIEERQGLRPRNYEQRLSNGQAAVGLRQLLRLKENVAHRAKLAALYKRQLEEMGFRVPQVPPHANPSWVRYPVCVDDRVGAIRALTRSAVLGTWFTSVLEEAESPSCGEYEVGSCPRAEQVARHLVNLPTHLRVTEEDVRTLATQLAVWSGRIQQMEGV
jgi:dTDP-4-amino-4,6-dideoxygalactose transaminase